MSFLIEKYAFRPGCCEITPCTSNPTSQAVVSGPCYSCGTKQEVGVWPDDLLKFKSGTFAQDCFPYLQPAQREFLISGICDKCWNDMFSEEEDHDDDSEES